MDAKDEATAAAIAAAKEQEERTIFALLFLISHARPRFFLDLSASCSMFVLVCLASIERIRKRE